MRFFKKTSFHNSGPINPLLKGIYLCTAFLFALTAAIYFFTETRFSMAADVVSIVTSDGIAARTEPEKTFFTISNMAPGDEETAWLTVYNDGQLDFSYMVDVELSSGSEVLFNVLDLKIMGSDGRQLFTGKFPDLRNVELGTLIAGDNEQLKFLIGFPIECGNEYQNLNALVNFVINVTERPYLLQVIWEPPLDESDVDVRNGRIMPVRFHLENNGVYDTVKRDLELVITGIDDYNNPVEYVFTVREGTLLWQAASQKPQYELPLLDAEEYPVKADTYYYATVKYGNLTLGSTQFKSGK